MGKFEKKIPKSATVLRDIGCVLIGKYTYPLMNNNTHYDSYKGMRIIVDNTKEKLWSRQCDITGEGMNEGYLVDEHTYIKYEKDLIKYIRSRGDKEFNKATDEYILKESYEADEHYWTEWEDEKDYQYIEDSEGNLTEID